MRKFSDAERERIREELVESGRELLLVYGPQKTTVKDITDPVGIAKPTFYQFFDAKADLYIEIFDRELTGFLEDLRTALDGVEDPRAQLEQYFRSYAEFGEENEFVQEVFLKRDYRDVIGNLSSEQIADLERKEFEAMVPPMQAIQDRSDGPIAEMEPGTVLGLMGSSIGMMVLHRDEFDEVTGEMDDLDDSIYFHLRETMIETLARGLTLPESA